MSGSGVVIPIQGSSLGRHAGEQKLCCRVRVDIKYFAGFRGWVSMNKSKCLKLIFFYLISAHLLYIGKRTSCTRSGVTAVMGKRVHWSQPANGGWTCFCNSFSAAKYYFTLHTHWFLSTPYFSPHQIITITLAFSSKLSFPFCIKAVIPHSWIVVLSTFFFRSETRKSFRDAFSMRDVIFPCVLLI